MEEKLSARMRWSLISIVNKKITSEEKMNLVTNSLS